MFALEVCDVQFCYVIIPRESREIALHLRRRVSALLLLEVDGRSDLNSSNSVVNGRFHRSFTPFFVVDKKLTGESFNS